MAELKNVHSYDRQLKNQYNPTKNYSNDEKRKLYTDFKEEITAVSYTHLTLQTIYSE